MKRLLFSVVATLLMGLPALAQVSQQWNATLAPNITAQSGIDITNRCNQRHSFEVQSNNVPFLTFSQLQFQVNGGQTLTVSARFDTRNMEIGTYRGEVGVICLTCRNEPGCTQNRENFQVVLNVAPLQAPVNNNPPNQGQNPPAGGQPNQGQNPTGGAQAQAAPAEPEPDWKGIPKDRIPRTTGIFGEFSSTVPGCPDCEKERLAAARAEAAAGEAQNKADAAKTAAENADKAAAEAARNAQKAGQAAQGDPEGGTITADGETFSQADSDFLDAKKDALFGEWQAGRISAEQHQAQRAALSGPDALKKAREERLAKLAELKKEAEKAKAAADKAKAEADKAKAAAAAAQAKADAAKREAEAALEEYRRCLKEAEERCRREAAARAAAAQAERDRQARAAAAAQAEEDAKKRKQEESRGRAKALFDLEYLFHNIDELKLIKTKIRRKKVPGALDPVFDLLQKLAGRSARDFLQTVTTMIGEGPISIDYISVLGELYQTLPVFLDPCTVGGMQQTKKKLLKMVNQKTGKKYTSDEADVKIEMMCKLMSDLKNKLEELKRLQAEQGK